MEKIKHYAVDNIRAVLIGGVGIVDLIVVNLFGVFSPLLYSVVLLMFFDLLTRCYAAGVREDERIESKKVIQGIWSKFGMLLLIAMALMIDYGINIMGNTLGDYMEFNIPGITLMVPFTLAWLFVRESVSVCENLIHGGVPVPKFIQDALSTTQKVVDKATWEEENER